MSNVSSLFSQAQLAEAAYAKLWNATLGQAVIQPDDVKSALIAEGFSVAQATAFVDPQTGWSVVDHIPDTSSGFSATLFQNKQTGKYTLAIRGSTDGTDFLADGALIANDGVAVMQLVDLYNYWQHLNAPDGQTYRAATNQRGQARIKSDLNS